MATDIQQTRICSKCGEEKPLTSDFFGRCNNKHCGFASYCKICKSAMDRLYRENNIERVRENKRRYNEENKEAIREKRMQRYQENKEAISQRLGLPHYSGSSAICVKGSTMPRRLRRLIQIGWNGRRSYRFLLNTIPGFHIQCMMATPDELEVHVSLCYFISGNPYPIRMQHNTGHITSCCFLKDYDELRMQS